MILLGCHDISYSIGVTAILKSVTMEIQDGEHAALIGVNGAGKSTLFQMIMGVYPADTGEIFTAKNLQIGYLEQNALFESDKTVWQEAMGIFAPLVTMEEKMIALEKSLSTEKNVDTLEEISKKYLSLSEEFKKQGGYEYQKRIGSILRGMGFDDLAFDLEVARLSGGQKTRLAIAKLLLTEPDLLLLDEPTNHLDIQTLSWLENFLKSYKKAFLVVSHDRYFLDAVTTKTIEIEGGKTKTYACSYTEYAARKKKDREVEQKHYENQQREIARQEAIIEQQRRFNRQRNIVAAESRQKALDRMEKVEAPTKLPGKMRLHFETAVLSGNDVLDVKNLSKKFPDKTLFSSLSFSLVRGQRVFLLGDNGVGKSTMFKMIEGREEKDGGTVHLGANVSVGYYDQELNDLNEDNTIIDEVWEEDPRATQTQIRHLLGSFLFCDEDVFKKISVLSGGEKARIALCKLLMNRPNLLLLDEPTNHLDIYSREVLEEALSEYDGTIFAISHDRYFINKLATRVLNMTPNHIQDFRGNYEEFLAYQQKKEEIVLKEIPVEEINEGKWNYQQEKQQQAAERKRQRDLEKAEKAIAKLEKNLAELDQKMMQEDVACDAAKLMELSEQRSQLEKELNEEYALWESLS